MLMHTPSDRVEATPVPLECSDFASFSARVIALWNSGLNTSEIASWLDRNEPDVYRALTRYLNKKYSTGWGSKNDAHRQSMT